MSNKQEVANPKAIRVVNLTAGIIVGLLIVALAWQSGALDDHLVKRQQISPLVNAVTNECSFNKPDYDFEENQYFITRGTAGSPYGSDFGAVTPSGIVWFKENFLNHYDNLAISPDGKMIALIAGESVNYSQPKYQLEVYDNQGNQVVAIPLWGDDRGRNTAELLQWSPNGRYISLVINGGLAVMDTSSNLISTVASEHTARGVQQYLWTDNYTLVAIASGGWKEQDKLIRASLIGSLKVHSLPRFSNLLGSTDQGFLVVKSDDQITLYSPREFNPIDISRECGNTN